MDKQGRDLWEMLSDYAREASVLILVFGALIPHQELRLTHGIAVGLGSVLLFGLGLIFELQRDRKG